MSPENRMSKKKRMTVFVDKILIVSVIIVLTNNFKLPALERKSQVQETSVLWSVIIDKNLHL